MDRGVLADLERREVEPVRRDLPAQLGDLAPGDALQPSSTSASDLGQLRVEVGRRLVAPGARRRLADERHARSAQSLGDEPEPLAIRLVREAAAKLSVGLGEVLGIARRGGTRAVGRRCRRVAAATSASAASRPPRSRGGRGPPGCGASARYLRGHARVPVAVAADPAPERRNAPTRGGRVPVRPVPTPAGAPGASSAASGARYSRGTP